jgi:hypothetical protein
MRLMFSNTAQGLRNQDKAFPGSEIRDMMFTLSGTACMFIKTIIHSPLLTRLIRINKHYEKPYFAKSA